FVRSISFAHILYYIISVSSRILICPSFILFLFFFNNPATTEIYTLSLHDSLPIYPGEITLYCLFWIALGIGAAITACAVILATCCIALIPYIGTVILLPLLVCLRAFGLRFIRQFGPDYDVWAAMPEASPTSSIPPPLPS